MNKYCEKCGCYLPIGEERCPACGHSELRTFDNAFKGNQPEIPLTLVDGMNGVDCI